MSLKIIVQAKAEQMLKHDAEFFGVTPTAVAKAIIDKVSGGGLTRDVLQGVDVGSYQDRKRGRPAKRRAGQ
jgi:formaldehyde-activating enzyme involved in methanogenesis